MELFELQYLDQKINWHPCSQMKDYEDFKPMLIKRARGSFIEMQDGRKIIDAISSWWCKSLGHNHPELKEALLAQIELFEHVVFTQTTSEAILNLSQKLLSLVPHMGKVFYAGDGASSIEIALKMSLHSRVIRKNLARKGYIALKNGYHGESMGALSVSDMGIYKDPYQDVLFEPVLIDPCYVLNTSDPLWRDASEHWQAVEKQLAPIADTITAVVLEPILQAVSGMKLYSKDFLSRLCAWAKAHDIHIIADEIMTGIGRTGKMFAHEHASIEPDFMCLGKGLTSGWLAFSAVVTTNDIYNNFYDEYERGKSFLHSNTFSGNPLGAVLAYQVIQIVERDNLCDRGSKLQAVMRGNMQDIANKTGALDNIRGIGAVIAADIASAGEDRVGFKVYKEAVKRGALLRPIGNTIYWVPPLNIELKTLDRLKDITLESILAAI